MRDITEGCTLLVLVLPQRIALIKCLAVCMSSAVSVEILIVYLVILLLHNTTVCTLNNSLLTE